jgi:hypothetical protein
MKTITMEEAKTMKSYLFNIENGLYEGETFEEPDMLQYEEGITPVPPPEFDHGNVPVFDREKNDWAVIPVSIARQLLNLSNIA